MLKHFTRCRGLPIRRYLTSGTPIQAHGFVQKWLHSEKSNINTSVVVSQKGEWRQLSFGDLPIGDTLLQGKIRCNEDKIDPASRCDYVNSLISAGLTFTSALGVPGSVSASEILFVGLGIGSCPSFFARLEQNLKLDIVEIDPAVIKVATEYFEFPITKMRNVYPIDVFAFLNSSTYQSLYNSIYLDIFNQFGVPDVLLNKDLIVKLKDKLKKNGVLACNVYCDIKSQNIIMNNFKSTFKTVHLLGCESDSSNIIVVAYDRQGISMLAATDTADLLAGKYTFDFDLARTLKHGIRAGTY
jgi:hypothetical protein